jgi:hypothetical protein
MVLFVGLLFYKSCGPVRAPPEGRETSVEASPAKPVMTTEERKRFVRTVLVMTSIKQAMRDPDSISWTSVLTSDDASVVCVTYRAKNGFGGMNIEHATGLAAGISTSTRKWNKHCATNLTLNDMTSAQFAVP